MTPPNDGAVLDRTLVSSGQWDSTDTLPQKIEPGNPLISWLWEHFEVHDVGAHGAGVDCPECRKPASVLFADSSFTCTAPGCIGAKTLVDLADAKGWDPPPKPPTIADRTAADPGLRQALNVAADEWDALHGPEATEREGANPSRRFRLLRAGELETKPTEWLVKGIIEQNNLAEVFGDPGSFKTFVALSLGLAVAAGSGTWYRSKAASGPVVYVAGEGRAGILRRLTAWAIDAGVSLDSVPFYVSNQPTALIEPAMLAQTVTAIAEDIPEPPVLVILDTLNRNMGPGDENNAVDMTLFVQACDTIRERFGCAVLIVHHSGHTAKERSRGHSALKAALDFEYRTDKGDDGVIRLECTKAKDHEAPDPLAFHPRSIALPWIDEDGEPETSIVLDLTAFEAAPKAGTANRGRWQTLALEVLDRMTQEQRNNVEASGRDPDTARVRMDDWRADCRTAGMPRRRVTDTLNSLIRNGEVILDFGFVERGP